MRPGDDERRPLDKDAAHPEATAKRLSAAIVVAAADRDQRLSASLLLRSAESTVGYENAAQHAMSIYTDLQLHVMAWIGLSPQGASRVMDELVRREEQRGAPW